MNLWPFIEAEKAEHHGVKRACELLQVSRAAHYEWSVRIPTARALRRMSRVPWNFGGGP